MDGRIGGRRRRARGVIPNERNDGDAPVFRGRSARLTSAEDHDKDHDKGQDEELDEGLLVRPRMKKAYSSR
jgi:hypothetical protein